MFMSSTQTHWDKWGYLTRLLDYILDIQFGDVLTKTIAYQIFTQLSYSGLFSSQSLLLERAEEAQNSCQLTLLSNSKY